MAKRKLCNFFDNCSSDSDSFDESNFDEHQSLLDGYNTDTELDISDGSETETTMFVNKHCGSSRNLMLRAAAGVCGIRYRRCLYSCERTPLNSLRCCAMSAGAAPKSEVSIFCLSCS